MTRRITHERFLVILAVLFAIEFVILAVTPFNRKDWALENALVAAFVLVIWLTYKSFPLSRISYTLIFIFLCLHEIGAHYTYAEVPYESFFVGAIGFSLQELLGWERNNFDRVIHFLFGALLAYPIREVYCRIANARGFWAYFFPLELTMATSMLFELFEWLAAEIFGGELGIAYLGTQGDVWDAHKDMALASLGALLAMLVTILINVKLQKNFREEWRQSLRIKSNRPLGEDEIARLLRERK